MKIQTLVKNFALQISGRNFKKPISTDTFAVLNERIDQHAVAVFRNQYLENELLLEFAETFGPLEVPLPFDQYGGVHENITMLANADNKGNLLSPVDKHSIYMKGNLP